MRVSMGEFLDIEMNCSAYYCLFILFLSCGQDPSYKEPERFGFGEEADSALIDQWNISIPPDGKGLPPGQGSAKQGALVYQAKCIACHGKEGWEGPYDALVMREGVKTKTIGNYWPYATTIFDYVRRAMPYNAPGSLSDEEVYQLTAFLLYANGLLGEEEDLHAKNLPLIEMPAKKLYVPDDRNGGREIR